MLNRDKISCDVITLFRSLILPVLNATNMLLVNVRFSLSTDCNQANEANLSVRHQTLAVRTVFMLPDYGRVNLHCNHPGKHYWLLLSDYEKMAN